MSSAITPKQILDAVQRIPEERWGEVLHAIEGLQIGTNSSRSSLPPVKTGTDLRGSTLIGVWADRADLADSKDFARHLRQKAEQRNGAGSSHAAGH